MKLLIQKHTSVGACLAAYSPVSLTSVGFRLQLKCLTQISIFKKHFKDLSFMGKLHWFDIGDMAVIDLGKLVQNLMGIYSF